MNRSRGPRPLRLADEYAARPSGPRLVLAEGSPVLRDSLARSLALAHCRVLAVHTDTDSLLETVHTHVPDVVLLDVPLPPSPNEDGGFRAALTIATRHPGVAVLLLSQCVDAEHACRLVAARSDRLGYLCKNRVAEFPSFLEAVHRVADGAVVLDPEVLAQLALHPDGRLSDEEAALLTPGSSELLLLDDEEPADRETLALVRRLGRGQLT